MRKLTIFGLLILVCVLTLFFVWYNNTNNSADAIIDTAETEDIVVTVPEPTPTSTDVPKPTPTVTPEPTPTITPEATPEPTPEITLEPTPESTPVITPEPTPEITPEPTPQIVITESRKLEAGKDSEEIIWNFLLKYAPNEYAAAGVMSMIFFESDFKSDAIYGWTYHMSYDPSYCSDFIDEINEGLTNGSTRDYFVVQSQARGGFGLCQYWSSHYLYDLYDFAQEWGTTMADAEMQCAFVFYDIENNRPLLYESLLNAKSAYEAGIIIGVYYEGVGANAPNTVGPKAQWFYNKYVLQDGQEN